MGGKKKGGGGGSKKAKRGNKQTPPKNKAHKGGREEASAMSSSRNLAIPSSVPGLMNLGNTCFFNSVMQSLNQSHYFRLRLQHLMATPTFTQELQLPNSQEFLQIQAQEELGPLTTSLWKFMSSMQERSSGTLNPRPVFSEICRKAARFSSHAQQDSQELLHYLLDALRQEEIHRIKHAILMQFNVGKSCNKNLTDKKRSDIKAFGRQADLSRTFVDEVFGGFLVSTVTCDTCTCCTKVQETFLDLSLPVRDGKSTSLSKNGSQEFGDKNKKNKVASPTCHSSVEDSDSLEKETGYTKKLSKHQKKKMEREKKKTDKKSKKMTLSELHKRVSQPDNDSSAAARDGSLDPSSPTAEQSLSTGGTSVSDKVDPASVLGGAETTQAACRVDPATGENTLQAKVSSREDGLSKGQSDDGSMAVPDNNSALTTAPSKVGGGHDQETLGASIELQNDQNDEDGADAGGSTRETNSASNYASSGPQPDSPVTAPNALVLGTAGADAPDASEGAGRTAQTGAACEDSPHPDNDTLEHSDATGRQLGGAGPLPGHMMNSHSGRTSMASVQFEQDSVEMSLKEFCTTERLTGDNQFACGQCNARASAAKSKEKARQDRTRGEIVQKDESSLAAGNQDVNGNMCAVPDQGSGGASCDGEGGAVGSEVDGSEDSNHQSSVLSDEELEPSDGDLEESQDELSSVVFCDATKQLLIHTLPIVLTLHLKRFSQHGRQLKKNGRHIKFPFQLDLSPYCMDSCRDKMCDESGRLLYSLFAVVEHSGSMLGGHYVAYVKQRPAMNPVQVDQICSWRTAVAPEDTSDPSSPSSSSCTPGSPVHILDNSVAAPDNSVPAPSNSVSTLGNSIPMLDVSVTAPDNSIPTSASTPDNSVYTPGISVPTPDNSTPTPDNSVPIPDISSPTPNNSASTPGNSVPIPDISTPTPNNSASTPGNSVLTPDSSVPALDDTLPTQDNYIPTPDNILSTPLNGTSSPNNSQPPTPNNFQPPATINSPGSPNSTSLPSLDALSAALLPLESSQRPALTASQLHDDHADSSVEEDEDTASVSTNKIFDTSLSEGQWYHVSDSHVTKSSPEEVAKSQAYLLFYELLPFQV